MVDRQISVLEAVVNHGMFFVHGSKPFIVIITIHVNYRIEVGVIQKEAD